MVLSNMSVEMGAKAGVFPADPVALEWTVARGGRLQEAVVSDIGATVGREIVLETDALEPRVALPHDPANGVPVSEAAGAAIDFVFLGTCTGGRVHDFHEALRVLELGGGIAPGVTVVVTPPTPHVRGVLTDDGTLARLEALGAVVTETGCGPCCGTSPPIPPENARVLSTANRNFQARMGRASASVYLASPGTCAAGATAGRIVDPREVA
jgi:3-isopropylmalate/(R)-2-methylmalate dehydratase large subunit